MRPSAIATKPGGDTLQSRRRRRRRCARCGSAGRSGRRSRLSLARAVAQRAATKRPAPSAPSACRPLTTRQLAADPDVAHAALPRSARTRALASVCARRQPGVHAGRVEHDEVGALARLEPADRAARWPARRRATAPSQSRSATSGCAALASTLRRCCARRWLYSSRRSSSAALDARVAVRADAPARRPAAQISRRVEHAVAEIRFGARAQADDRARAPRRRATRRVVMWVACTRHQRASTGALSSSHCTGRCAATTRCSRRPRAAARRCGCGPARAGRSRAGRRRSSRSACGGTARSECGATPTRAPRCAQRSHDAQQAVDAVDEAALVGARRLAAEAARPGTAPAARSGRCRRARAAAARRSAISAGSA